MNCLLHSLLFFSLDCDRICTLAAREGGRNEKERKERGKEEGKERRNKGDRGEKREEKENVIFMSHIY